MALLRPQELGASPAFDPPQATQHRKVRPSRLVSSRVATLPPGTYTDPGQPGLQLRVRSTEARSARSWLFRFKFRGEESRLLIGHFPETSLEAARAIARAYRDKARQGIDPRRAGGRRRQARSPAGLSADVAGPLRHTVEHLVEDYLIRHAGEHHRRPEYARRILKKEVLTQWRGRDARTITPVEVLDLLDQVLDRGAKVMANRLASVLSQLFRWGIHRRIVEDSPVKLFYRPGGRERPRDRMLEDEEIRKLISIEPMPRWDRLHRTINLLLLTGQRRGELGLAKWADIDLKERTWRIPAEVSKNGRGHVVPLSDWAVEEFKSLKREAEGSQFVYPEAGDPTRPADPKLLTRNLARARQRFENIGIGEFHLHDLRRTCRTGLARLKVDPHVAERILNHVQERIPGTYDVYDYLPEKREALSRWATYLAKLKS
jgi:integrase